MNDALVISTCKLIAAHHDEKHQAKPFQFHTELGDNDINLLSSTPACLQPLIKEFPSVPIILLHSSYPFTREAGYLATCYKTAFLDIGEVFPMVSRDCQESIIRQALELTPSSKILWSTDGHHFPETYWLANKQGRQAIETVMCSYVERGDLTLSEAAQSVRDIFFGNSNKLYDLNLIMPEVEPTISPGVQAVNLDQLPESQALDTFLKQHTNIKYVNVMWLDILGT
ncbi:Hypothetical protein R9X50_00077800 [Acrodontium crateriforme]|uniref:Amidohydrolase-related domain-containing protein n=1 Tax=Acrodontium crateriforme TaxID=150365 RepID=A0AAQ3R295_9PEZI|nr:Hypothetical protein R9X50_00077800 [Acrodontium crateriforme]